MASQGAPRNPAGHRRAAVAIAIFAGLAAIMVLLVVLPGVTGDGWGVLNSPRSPSSATPEPGPTARRASGPAAPAAQRIKACIKQTKGEEVYEFFLRDIPPDRWGEPVSGTLSTFSEPYALWLFDADCKPYQAVAVPARTSRTFTAYVGQVWYYTEASAKQTGDSYDYGVFSPSNSGARKTYGDTGSVVYRTG
jgi:hypothetical protein